VEFKAVVTEHVQNSPFCNTVKSRRRLAINDHISGYFACLVLKVNHVV